MSDLSQLLAEEVFPYELNPEWERVVNVKVVEAARKVFDPITTAEVEAIGLALGLKPLFDDSIRAALEAFMRERFGL